MRVIAYSAVHYGKDYFGYALNSVYASVDEIHILYAIQPSYGHGTSLQCPDAEDELRAIAEAVDVDKKLHWHRGVWHGEGEHRSTLWRILGPLEKDDIVLSIDADEVWCPYKLHEALEQVRGIEARNFLVPFLHFWKGFRWVCRDSMRPVRFIRPACEGDAYIDVGPVLHFGYARAYQDVVYKWAIHGHKTELRPGWLAMYRDWKPGVVDVHPVCVNGFWTPEPFDTQGLPELMHGHPYFDLPVVG